VVEQPQVILVRGRCACGRRYRIRNAQAGITVMCPACRRPIPITESDLRAAASDARLIPLQAENVEPLEAIPLDCGELMLAPEGSRPGLTGETMHSHEEAVLAAASRGTLALTSTFDDVHPAPAVGARVLIEFEPGQRAFVHDLLASFYFAGVPGNVLNVLVIAVACSLVALLQYMMFFVFLFIIFMIPIYGIIVLYAIQFYWSVLNNTAAGEDVIPWAQTDWSFWHDGFKPLIWMGVISFLCTLPRLSLEWFGPPALTADPTACWVALALGWFFWPVAVMSVALGNTILFVRPDWLIRCVIGIGPVYLVAWIVVMLAVAGWYFLLQYWYVWILIPVLGFAVNLYFGYVVFRTLGLLFRHFRARFPWKY
jgi:hypothetical protein